ncbi:MAG TPA: DUF3151 domain-containing protein [Mycobacteriales bacterium]|nr:DUF3151 domain-containing protein [Mycobacteriales bacterium]
MNLLAGPPPTRLPVEAEPAAALAAGTDPAEVAARWPACGAAWAALAEAALARGAVVEAYAYARTGYHRGLDALRRAGWKGHGPIPWSHEPNRGFLTCLDVLRRSAEQIDETAEATRCREFLTEAEPEGIPR